MNLKELNKEQKERLDLEIIEIIDDLKFEKDIKDFQEGRSNISIRIPNRNEILAMTQKYGRIGQPIKLSDWLKNHIQTMANLFQTPQLIGAGNNPEKLNTQFISYDGKEIEVLVFIQTSENLIEIYFYDEILVGKKIVVNESAAIIAECSIDSYKDEIEFDATIKEIQAIANLEIPQNIKLDQINCWEWKIV